MTEARTYLQQTYDELPYPNLSYVQTHPDRFATIATLMGLNPPPVLQARVLELGCASGANLIPMAYTLPDATFVGIDFSPVQIAAGQKMIAEMGLKNITLHAMDILDITPDFGEFDYIIAHGIYSWVPPVVRDKVVAIAKANLSPNGIAYISYNTYPGWHMLQAAREMMLYHIQHIEEPAERAEEAREFIKFLVMANPDPYRDVYSSFLHGYRELQNKQLEHTQSKDSALLHDELEEYNDPVFFYQFAEHLEQHGLQYLAEAEFFMVMPSTFPNEVISHLQSIAANLVDMEQYMDFLRNRTFRQTLVCHQDVQIGRSLNPGRLMKLKVSSQGQVEIEEADPERPEVARFRGTKGSRFATDHPLTKAALTHLTEISPDIISFVELLNASCQSLGIDAPSPEDAQMLAVNLLKAYTYGGDVVDFHTIRPPFSRHIPDQPKASAYARYHISTQNHPFPRTTNLLHGRVELGATNHYLLPFLDGTHNRADLMNVLYELLNSGRIKVQVEGETVTDEEQIRDRLERELDLALRWLAVSGMLIHPDSTL